MSKKRKKIPYTLVSALQSLQYCKGYEKGKTIGQLTQEIYDEDNITRRANARQIIARVRKLTNADIYSMKRIGGKERRYFHLSTVEEFTKIINDLKRKIDGLTKSKDNLEYKKEEKVKLLEERERAKKIKMRESQ